MRASLIIFVLPLALLAPVFSPVSRADETKPAPAAVDTAELIADLRGNDTNLFDYGSWHEKHGFSANGTVILGAGGAQGDGGIGRNFEPTRDLSQIAYVEVGFGVGGRNEVPEITVALNDADGTQVAARLRIDQIVPGQPVWLRVRRQDFVRVEGQNGSDSKMDWTKVAQWHLQGDWTTKKPCHVVFIAIRIRK